LEPTRPVKVPRVGSVVKELVPLKTLLPLKVLLFARSVEEAAKIVMSPVPLKETPLMRRPVWSAVAVPAFPPMESVEVLSAVTFPVAPVLLPRIVFAPMVGSCESESAFDAIPSVTAAPPIWEPREPPVTLMPEPTEIEEVATLAKVLGPLKYARLPCTAAVDVERPPKERVGEVPPLEMIGKVPETEVTPVEEVAMKARPPVVLDQPRT
jgi:hypothetical protein